MKYMNEEKTLVRVDGMFIPKGHRLWEEYDVDNSEVSPYTEPYTILEAPPEE